MLQARERGDTAAARFGFTVSKKVGTAVERNRVRRRLRDIVRRHAALATLAGHDYVLIGRRAALHHAVRRDDGGIHRRAQAPAQTACAGARLKSTQ